MRFSSPLRAAFLSLALASIAAAAPAARAAFLIDPTGGTTLTSFTSNDDGNALRNLGGTFSLYGTNFTSLFVHTNGYLAGIASSTFDDRSITALTALGGGATTPVIAPYFDDLIDNNGQGTTSALGNTIVEKVVSGSYYSVTYNVNGINDTTASATAKFQSVLFTGATTINGNSFLAGDIVFSYNPLTNSVDDAPLPTGNGSFTVGVAQNGTNGTGAFGGDGQFATNSAFLSNFNLANQAILFRFSPTGGTGGGGTYTQSLIPLVGGAAAPEPGSLALAAGVLPLAGGIIARRKRRTAA